MKITEVSQIVEGLTIMILREPNSWSRAVNGENCLCPLHGNVKFPVTITVKDVQDHCDGGFPVRSFTDGSFGWSAHSIIEVGAEIVRPDKRFPFDLKRVDAVSIVKHCKPSTSSDITALWARPFFFDETIPINENIYKQLRAKTKNDYPLEKMLDKVFGKDPVYPPYKQGDLIIVRESASNEWRLRYFHSYSLLDNVVECYDNQMKEGLTSSWRLHHPCTAVLPEA